MEAVAHELAVEVEGIPVLLFSEEEEADLPFAIPFSERFSKAKTDQDKSPVNSSDTAKKLHSDVIGTTY